MDAVVYIHGKGGSAQEAAHFKPLFPGRNVIGMEYSAQTPWQAKDEFGAFFDALCQKYASISLIANSIGAFYAMHAGIDAQITQAFFISPVVDLEKQIQDKIRQDACSGVQQNDSQEGEKYLTFVRTHPLRWHAPTSILYGSGDELTPRNVITAFANKIGARLTVMEGGEHWFHTPEQMRFLDQWLWAQTDRRIAYCEPDCAKCDAYLAATRDDPD